MKRILLAAAMALTVLSCTMDPLDIEQRTAAEGHLRFEVQDDDNIETKSYLVDGTTWSYNWETGDEIYFVSRRNGSVHQSGIATVTKSTSKTYINIDAPLPFQANDVVYAYYSPGCDQATGSTTVQMSIPALQYTVIGKDKYVTTETVSSGSQTVAFTFSGALDQTSVSNQTSKTPPARTLTVTVPGYDSSLSYTYSTDNRTYNNLSVNSSGKANISVSFSQISFSGNNGSTSKTVYIKCKGGNAASIKVNVTGTKSSSGGWGGWGGSSSKYTYTYSLGNVTAGSYQIPGETVTNEVISYSADKALLARDAMPLVASGVTVTSAMASGSASITSSMSFKMLGSALDLRIYSLDSTVGAGETIKTVKFTASSNISGTFNYNLQNNPLTISGLNGQSVTADVEGCGYTVGNSKTNYQSVYMIVAPGTYSATFEITTDKYVYTAQLSSKSYSRSSKKSINLNIAGSSFTRTEVVTPAEPDDPDNPDDPDDPQDPQDPPTDPEDPPTDPQDPPTDPQDPPAPPAYEWETTYAVFASDRHSNTSAISTAFRNMPSAVPYVCLVGDMEGSRGGDHPAYNSSTIKAEVDAVFPNATTQIFWADHDASVNDNANIVKGATAGSSALAYTAYDSHGRVQYYVYNIAFYDMNSASNGQTAAAAFESWVDTITDHTIPIFVACHIPIHAARNDNYGAYYWNRAITYAATGSETGTASAINRNVIFFHGHNHTNEANKEYYYAPGSSISVAKSGGNVTCAIPYTYVTGGYLNANKKATLVQVNETDIVLTKYGSGSATQLGTVTRVQ